MIDTHDSAQAGSRAQLRVERQGRVARVIASGEWTVRDAQRMDSELRGVNLGGASEAVIDGNGITRLDSAGTWLLVRAKRDIEAAGARVTQFLLPDVYAPLLHTIEVEHNAPPVVMESRHGLNAFLYRVGYATVDTGRQGYRMLGYLGRFTIELMEAVFQPRGNLRVAALFTQVEEIGINALPIVGLLSFLIGIVMAYQGADQLRRFGAEIFTINLLGVGILRELGGLVTAIIIAGRSGSAFTAQIGTMKVNEEIDALQTIGINTFDVLVLPRVMGLIIALPFLTFYADVMAMIGGAVMCYFDLGITVPAFMRQLHEAISVNTFLVGIIKAPIFAATIGLVGCFEGLQVERNAASVGKLTTRAVVELVFLVIVIDAAFSILFSILGQSEMAVRDKEVVIKVRGLVNIMGGNLIHDHIDLDVYRGEVLGVVGGSGAGKSVLLHSIVGLNKPREGHIEVFGEDPTPHRERPKNSVQMRWGVLFQEGALFSSQTVAENIQVPLREYTDMDQDLMNEVTAMKLSMVGLPQDAARKFPSELSGGMKKRAGLARALAADPELVFLDEPTAGLDPISANQFDELVKDLQKSLGLTVFMVTHDLDTLKATTDRIAVLVNKKIKIGTIDELREDPDPWIQEYFSGVRGRAALAS